MLISQAEVLFGRPPQCSLTPKCDCSGACGDELMGLREEEEEEKAADNLKMPQTVRAHGRGGEHVGHILNSTK